MKTDSSIVALYGQEQSTQVVCPLFSSWASAGFPSPAEDHIDQSLDLNALLIRNPAATFFVRVAGDSITGCGIQHGGILVVDRSFQTVHGRVVVAVFHGELTVRRLVCREDLWYLEAENSIDPAVAVTEENGSEVWGIVTSVIHQFPGIQ